VAAVEKFFSGFLVVVAICVPLWFGLFPSAASVNYKLSIDVDDNGVIRHGEGVIGVVFRSNGFPTGIGGGGYTPWNIVGHGQAIPIDLGQKGTLFALMPSGDSCRLPHGPRSAGEGALSLYFHRDFRSLSSTAIGWAQIEWFAFSQKPVTITADELPLLVRFRDIDNLQTIESVNPDQLDATFGPGVKIVRAVVELTNESVTTGIETKLPALRTAPNRPLSGALMLDCEHPENNLSPTNFE
jgi:hypothetical protein